MTEPFTEDRPCSKCGVVIPAAERSRRNAKCRPCIRVQQREKYASDKDYREDKKARANARYEEKREEIIEASRVYYETNKEALLPQRAEYRVRVVARIAEVNKEYRLGFYKLDQETYDQLLESQGSACGICGKSSSEFSNRLAVDHDHRCCPGMKTCGKCVRGLLCPPCNSFRADHDPEWMDRRVFS